MQVCAFWNSVRQETTDVHTRAHSHSTPSSYDGQQAPRPDVAAAFLVGAALGHVEHVVT